MNTQQITGNLNFELKDMYLSNVVINANINVNTDGLFFDSSISQINNGIITLSDKGTILAKDQAPNLSNNASLVFAGTYSVFYIGKCSTTKTLISDTSKLVSLLIHIDSGRTFTVESNLSISYHLDIHPCTVVIDNRTIIMGDSSGFSHGKDTYFSVSPETKLVFNHSGKSRAPVNFIPGHDTLSTLDIDFIKEYTQFILGSNLYIKDTLNIQTGSIHLKDSDLKLLSGSTFTHIDTSSRISTEGEGTLIRYIQANDSVNFPLSTNYRLDTLITIVQQRRMPISITNNGSNGVYIGARVMQDVYKDPVAATGIKLSHKIPLVRCTWFLSSDNNMVNLDVHAIWLQYTPPTPIGNIEVNKFNRDNCYLSNYINSSWDLAPKGAATDLGNDYYTITRKDVTSLGAFAVFQDTFLSVDNTIVKSHNTITLHPNPATDKVVLQYDDNQPAVGEILDITGKLIKSVNLHQGDNEIPIVELSAGVYLIKIKGERSISTTRFVKQ